MDRCSDESDEPRPLLPENQRRGPERKTSASSSMQTRPDPSTLHQTSGPLLPLFCADLDLASAMPFFADRFTDASEDACSLLAFRQEMDRCPDVTFPPLCNYFGRRTILRLAQCLARALSFSTTVLSRCLAISTWRTRHTENRFRSAALHASDLLDRSALPR